MWHHSNQACNKSVPQFSTANQKLCTDPWINLMVQPNSRGTIPWFPCPIPQSTIPLVPVCHSRFPIICCTTACLKCLWTNGLSLPHLNVLQYIQWRVLDSNGERSVSYKKPNPPPVVVAKNENIPVMCSLPTGHRSQSHSHGTREARWIVSTGALLQFLWQKWLGVLLLFLDEMPVHCRWPTVIVRLPSQIGQYHLHPWSVRSIERVRCLALEHDTVTLAWAPLWTYWSGIQLTNHWTINSWPPPNPPPHHPLPT